MPRAVRVADVSDVKPGGAKVVEAEGKAIALFNVNGRFYALENVCLHRGGPVGEGELNGEIVTCPWHGWRYNVTTGEHVLNKAIRLRTYRVIINNNDIIIEL